MKNAFSTVLCAEYNSEEAIRLAADLVKSGFLVRREDKVKNAFSTVLYTEHDSQQRIRLAADLKHCGFLVRTAECAFDALELTTREEFDVMILDYDLPDMTGAQLAQEIRALEPLTQILLLSRRPHLPAGELAYVDFHAVKGLPFDALIEIIESLLGSPTLSPESAASSRSSLDDDSIMGHPKQLLAVESE